MIFRRGRAHRDQLGTSTSTASTPTRSWRPRSATSSATLVTVLMGVLVLGERLRAGCSGWPWASRRSRCSLLTIRRRSCPGSRSCSRSPSAATACSEDRRRRPQAQAARSRPRSCRRSLAYLVYLGAGPARALPLLDTRSPCCSWASASSPAGAAADVRRHRHMRAAGTMGCFSTPIIQFIIGVWVFDGVMPPRAGRLPPSSGWRCWSSAPRRAAPGPDQPAPLARDSAIRRGSHRRLA